MSPWARIGVAATIVALLGSAAEAATYVRKGLYPLTRCGPDLAHLCPIRGYFDQAPFQYKLAIYPGCIKTVKYRTPRGLRYERILVCG